MTDLETNLEAIGLGDYLQQFRREGFDTWHQLMDVTEVDLESLGVRLGHRRRLQRAIQEARQSSGEEPLRQASSHQQSSASQPSGESRSDASDSRQDIDSSNVLAHRPSTSKRKYRRHAKPDDNAPERSPSAYVLFSNKLRERLKGQDLSFTEIAKIVGREWQDPNPEERAECERDAQARKEAYYAAMAEYKKTPEWSDYQEYLLEFKAKHGDQNALAEAKRVRTGPDAEISRRGSSQEAVYIDRSPSSETALQDGLTPISRTSANDSYHSGDSNGIPGQASWRAGSYSPAMSRFGLRPTGSGPPSATYSADHILQPPYAEYGRDNVPHGARADIHYGRNDSTMTAGNMRAPSYPTSHRGGASEQRAAAAAMPPFALPSPHDPRSRMLPMPAGFSSGQPSPDTFSTVRQAQQVSHNQTAQPQYREAAVHLSLPPLKTAKEFSPRGAPDGERA